MFVLADDIHTPPVPRLPSPLQHTHDILSQQTSYYHPTHQILQNILHPQSHPLSKMTTASNTRFNAEAAAWDSNPTVRKASELALQSFIQHIPALDLSPDPEAKALPRQRTLDVLEIGRGTGLLSFLI